MQHPFTMDAEEIRHVHFRDAENVGNKPASNGIIIEQLSLSELRVHLGFLQIYHVYELRIAIDKPYIPFMSPHNVQEIHSSIVAGPCVRVLKISDENEQYWDLTVHLKARRERLLKEPLKMQFGEQKIEIVLYARVLGRGKGTPSLKSGIQSIAVEPDEESEVSDWRGFD